MFLPNSRYAKVATVTTTTSAGATVVALKLRHLTPAGGQPHTVHAGDRLDLYAQARSGDATQFWHMADANTALDSRTLVERPGVTITLPET
ncbi:LysM domain-containing protein [Pseudoduganella sp. SL102]|uniref:LysM domain-containing protein n=1 Tax=Pseudoduganella sp. SL102 TaxID=2995154 RepID=UPI00248BA4A5|nr:LysM domain-containing protein [Pseudoduganella sp. SL102]WBR99999.1 LysM domain-containing protein [Pseudoduganella sp. SL102]